MRIIEQIVDYLFQQGALNAEDEQYLADGGYIRPRSWLAPDEVRAGPVDLPGEGTPSARKDSHEGLISELERTEHARSGRRGAPLSRLSAQAISARIRAARPAWRDRLGGLLPLARTLQPDIDADEAALAIGRVEVGPLADAVARLLTERKAWLPELWEALCVDEYRGLVPEKGVGPAADAWSALLRAACLQDLDRHVWILRHRQCAWVYQLRSAQRRLLQALGVLFARRDPALERALLRDSHPTGFWALALLYNGRRILQGHPAGEALPYLSECAPSAPLPSARSLGDAAALAAQMDHEGLIALLRASSRPQWRIAAMDYQHHRITVRDLRDPLSVLLTVEQAGFCDLSPDGLRLAMITGDSFVHVYDIRTEACSSVLGGDTVGVKRVIYCARGTMLLAIRARDDEWVMDFYDAASLQLLRSRILPNSGSNPRLEVAVCGDLFAITCERVVQVWDTRTIALVAEIEAHGYHPPQAIALSPDGHIVVTVCASNADNANCLYAAHLPKRRARTHRSNARIIGEAEHGYTYHMLYTGDGHTVALAYEDGTVALFDVATRTVRKEWKAHTGHASSLDVNPDGTILLSAGDDGCICLWDARNGDLLQRITVRTKGVAKIGQGLLRPVARELQLVCPSAWRQPYPSRKTAARPE